MTPEVPVKIQWLGEWAKKPPEGTKWSAPAYFDHQPKPWPPKESWSVILRSEDLFQRRMARRMGMPGFS